MVEADSSILLTARLLRVNVLPSQGAVAPHVLMCFTRTITRTISRTVGYYCGTYGYVNQWSIHWQPVVEIASGESAHQSFQKIAQRRAILIFSAILAKRGNASLGLNLDLHGYQIKTAVFMSPPVFFFFFSLMLYEVCSCVAPV